MNYDLQDAPNSEWLTDKQHRFEYQRVRWLLRQIGVKAIRHEMLDDEKSETGEHRLTFRAFNRVEKFPMYLGARWINVRDDEVQLRVSNMFRSFESSVLGTAFREFIAQTVAEQRQREENMVRRRVVGVVVPFGHIHQGLLIHTGVGIPTTGLKWSADVGTVAGQMAVTIEPFAKVVKGILADGWQPTTVESEHGREL